MGLCTELGAYARKEDVPMTQEARRTELYGLLGKLPDRQRPISATKLFEEEREHDILEKLLLDLNGVELVPAYYLRPKRMAGPSPAILYNHAHGGKFDIGKEEVLNGRTVLQKPPYGELLTRMGMSVLCIDTWAFGERKRGEQEIFKEMLWNGRAMWGMMLYDNIRALDYLIERPEVDASRIGTIGLSMGSTMSWWLAALDTRIKATVDICCMTEFQALLSDHGLNRHGIYYFVYDLLNHFTTTQVNELIIPRPHLCLAGEQDALTPIAGLKKIDRELSAAYAAQGVADAWKMSIYDCGHEETPGMRTEIIEFLERWL
jgi:dienelactone hydrolase